MVILVATILSFGAARNAGPGVPGTRPPRPGAAVASPVPASAAPDLSREIAELRREVAEDSLLEEVFENPWFEVSGFVGTGCIAASFFAEWTVRRRKLAAERGGVRVGA